MCGRIKIDNHIVRPNQIIPTKRFNEKPVVWGSLNNSVIPFARIETLQEKWLSKGWLSGQIKVDDFAELDSRPEHLKHQNWNGGCVTLQAIMKEMGKYYSLVLVTRETTKEESTRFHHPRMPMVLEGLIIGPKKD